MCLHVIADCIFYLFAEELEPENKQKQNKPKRKPEKLPAVTMVNLFAARRRKLLEKKLLIGTLASSITEDPEENVSQM